MEKVSGVNWKESLGKWRAQINVKGKSYSLGYFCNYSDAVKARKEAEKHFGVNKTINRSDLDGERFGLLTVIGDTGKRRNRSKVLLCRHDNGEIYEFDKRHLIRGYANGKFSSETKEKYISINKSGSYRVRIRIDGKERSFGTFTTLEQAITKRDEILLLIEQGKL